MTVLLAADGPFKGCDGRHSDLPVGELPHDPPPDGMFELDEHPEHPGPAHAWMCRWRPRRQVGRVSNRPALVDVPRDELDLARRAG
jgi:hypothetical protein